MIVRKATESEVIAVACREDVYDSIPDDGSPEIQDYKPSKHVLFIAGLVDNVIIGLMAYHKWLDGVKCHIHVLPEHRKHARKFARMALKFGEAKNAIIYTEIPECFKSVSNFAKKFGFKVVGYSEKSFIKSGQAYNSEILRLNNVVY